VSESRKPLDHWLAPAGAGKPMACLATSFTFEIDFFEQECLGRFLGLDWKRDEGDELAFIIEQEEKLAETAVTVIVDRNSAVEGRSLRWDLLPVGMRGGVMHAKVSLLVWENLVRCTIGSANLTSHAYRSNREVQAVLDASPQDGPPTAIFGEAISALRELVNRVRGLPTGEGPRRGALATLRVAESRLATFGERKQRPGAPRFSIALGGPGRRVLDEIVTVWRGPRPRRAIVLSPFFDAPGKDDAGMALADLLAVRGRSQVDFVVDTGIPDLVRSRVPVQAPRSLLDSLPDRIEPRLFSLDQGEEKGEFRRLHAKGIVLESDKYVAALVGSSNFTRPGLCIDTPTNLEVNLVVGAPIDSAAGKALSSLIPIGERISPEEAEWEEAEDIDDEPEQPELPWGFVSALVDPGSPPLLRLTLGPADLPDRWTIEDHSGATLATSQIWQRNGKPEEFEVRLPAEALPFFVVVRWRGSQGPLRATWPVNVTDKAALPPPEELHDLPVDALLAALASTRPLHEGLSDALNTPRGPLGGEDELNPLHRFDGSGQLMRRARAASEAFAGLRRRLEKPVANVDALVWRLQGPFGPTEIAAGLIKKSEEGRTVPGEASFLLAELALTLSRVDWRQTGRLMKGGTRVARKHARDALESVRQLRSDAEEHELLSAYVERAFREARL
jgi:HKD family nuclease